MKSLLLIGFLTAFTVSKSHYYEPSFNPRIICNLTSDKMIYKIGELPKFKVEISNNTKNEIYLIGSLDGSDAKWRFPHCYFEMDKETRPVGRCGNMNGIGLEDFRLIKPGQKFDPYDGFFSDLSITDLENFNTLGIYKIRFYYSTNSSNFKDYEGDQVNSINYSDSLKIISVFHKVPKVELQSNQIEIRFEK